MSANFNELVNDLIQEEKMMVLQKAIDATQNSNGERLKKGKQKSKNREGSRKMVLQSVEILKECSMNNGDLSTRSRRSMQEDNSKTELSPSTGKNKENGSKSVKSSQQQFSSIF